MVQQRKRYNCQFKLSVSNLIIDEKLTVRELNPFRVFLQRIIEQSLPVVHHQYYIKSETFGCSSCWQNA